MVSWEEMVILPFGAAAIPSNQLEGGYKFSVTMDTMVGPHKMGEWISTGPSANSAVGEAKGDRNLDGHGRGFAVL